MRKYIISLLLAGITACSAGCQTPSSANQSNNKDNTVKESTVYLCIPTKAPTPFTDMINFEGMERITGFTVLSTGEIWFGTGGFTDHIFHTKNAGRDWESVKMPNPATIAAFDFIDSQNAVLVDFSFNFWKTINGGNSWDKTTPFKSFAEQFAPPREVKFSSLMNGAIVLSDKDIYETIDGGKTWKALKIPSFTDISVYYRMNDDNSWIALGKNSTVMYVLRKEGSNFKQYTISNAANYSDPQAMFFLDQNSGWISSDMGELFSTKDGGKNWSKIYTDTQNVIKEMFWADPQVGWLVGSNKDNQAILLKTVDGGNSWKTVERKDEGFFGKIIFTDKNNGWLVSRERIYTTNDAGESWKPIVFASSDCK